MYFDPTYILVIIGAAICMIASSNVKSTYAKYAKIPATCGMTGAQAAHQILQMAGVTDVTVQHVSGNLTDHYNPSNKTVNLSDATYGSTSVAAIGVAAHECGHVMQHHTGYVPLQIRASLVPVANLGSKLGLPIVILSLILGLSQTFTMIGVVLFSFGVLFQIVTLPVEFDASSRALKMLTADQILSQSEVSQSKAVLHAAAMTYVASAASMILQLLRLLSLANRRRD